MKILVMHRGYGCETGCCGHVVEVEDLQPGEKSPLGEFKQWQAGALVGEPIQRTEGSFSFDHPWKGKDDFRKWAEDMVREECGEEHVKDLDWENSFVVDD